MRGITRSLLLCNLVLFAGCSRTSGGVVTDDRKPWAQDCGVSIVPPPLPKLTGSRVGDGMSILLLDSQLPQGGLALIDADSCIGAAAGGARISEPKPSFLIVRLELESEQGSNPSSAPMDATKPKRYRMIVVPKADWPKR